MCGAYGYSVKDAKEVYDRFEVSNTLEAYKPRWNVRIGQMAPVIYMSADGVQIKKCTGHLFRHGPERSG